MIETNLVDFKSLALDPTSTRRNELMKGVASLFAFASERCSLEQIEIYDEVLGRLSDMVETEVRAFAAEKLAPLRRAPEGVIRRLANDDAVEVASPVLAKSPVLTERDLMAVAESKGNGHLTAIAKRSNLSEQVTDVVVRRGDEQVKRTVAGNPGARLGDGSLEVLVRQAMTDVETAEALGAHPDTPDSVIGRLVDHAEQEVRRVLSGRGMKQAEMGLTEAARRAGERMSNAYWLGQYDFETAWEKLMQQGGSRVASESLLCQYAIEDRFADVVAVFAVLADLDLEEAKHWLVRTDTEPFVVIAKALGLRFVTVQALLKTGPWKHRLTTEQRREGLNQFNHLDLRVARSRIAVWRQTRLAG